MSRTSDAIAGLQEAMGTRDWAKWNAEHAHDKAHNTASAHAKVTWNLKHEAEQAVKNAARIGMTHPDRAADYAIKRAKAVQKQTSGWSEGARRLHYDTYHGKTGDSYDAGHVASHDRVLFHGEGAFSDEMNKDHPSDSVWAAHRTARANVMYRGEEARENGAPKDAPLENPHDTVDKLHSNLDQVLAPGSHNGQNDRADWEKGAPGRSRCSRQGRYPSRRHGPGHLGTSGCDASSRGRGL